MTEPVIGISIIRDEIDVFPATPADMSIVGLVGPAEEADADDFPLGTPVAIYSNDAAKLAALGEDGHLAGQLKLLNAQLAEFQRAAKVVIVRTEEGETVWETIQNIIDDGLPALLEAGESLGWVPRLVGVPGYTHQVPNGIGAITVGTQGSGYTSAPAVGFTGGGGTGAAGTAVLGSGGDTGKVVGVNITNPGIGYTSAPAVGFTGGGGTGAAATATLEALANPVCAALPGTLEKILAHAVIEAPGNPQAAKDWRELLQSERLIPVYRGVKVFEGASVVTVPSVGAVLGIGVRRDFEKGGFPFHSWGNQPIQGIVGPEETVRFSLTDGATVGQDLLLADIGIVVRGQLGLETAIADGGFVYLGTNNLSESEIWQFYNVTRGRDYIHLVFLRTLRDYLVKFNLTGQTVQAVMNTMGFILRDLKADDHILGYEVSFPEGLNSEEELRLGHVTIRFKAEEPPPITKITIRSARMREALTALLEDLVTQTETLVVG